MTAEIETPVQNDNTIREGDVVLFSFEENRVTYLAEMIPGRSLGIHCGKPIRLDDWIGKEFGSKVVCEHDAGYCLRPTTEDLMMKASRESGVIYPKDAAYLMIKLGIRPGNRVLEVGTGSGSLTLALATAIQPHGQVMTYDRRTDLPKNAVKNIRRAGLEAMVTFHQREAGEAFPENYFDAAILDIPTPWEELEVVKKALKGSARVASLNPTFNQIETAAETMKRLGFIRIECAEILERPILARAGKTRPVQRMVSHTEFLLFGTKVGE